MLDDLLAEVEARVRAQNAIVLVSLLSLVCNHQKAKLKLEELFKEHPELVGELPYVPANSWHPLWWNNYHLWRRWRSLARKMRFKSPCGACPLCV